MRPLVNIIIPSVELSNELIFCLNKLNNQTYRNFFVTIVLDKVNKKNLKNKNFRYKTKIIISDKRNMSYKRNLAAKKFKSDILAFLDSDAYPKYDWLKNAVKILYEKKEKIIGGPSIPFPSQKLPEMLCYYAKRSYFVTGFMNFRKYLAEERYCDWLESCNLFILRELYLKYGGMNEKKYLGEDKEFQERFKKKNPKLKVFYSSKIFVYHKERGILKFLLQRMAFGTDLFNITKFNNKISGFQPILPLLIVLLSLFVLFSKMFLNLKLIIFLVIFTSSQILILNDISRYQKKIKLKILTLILINFANIFYVIGNLFEILFLKKILNRKLYLRSRKA